MKFIEWIRKQTSVPEIKKDKLAKESKPYRYKLNINGDAKGTLTYTSKRFADNQDCNTHAQNLCSRLQKGDTSMIGFDEDKFLRLGAGDIKDIRVEWLDDTIEKKLEIPLIGPGELNEKFRYMMDDIPPTPVRGESEGKVRKLRKDNTIYLPDDLMDRFGWQATDKIDITETEDCFDWGEVNSLVLRNLSKELRDAPKSVDEDA